jgi:magnesium chelatase subunit H
MTTLTLILGMERFNAHIWDEVQRDLRAAGVDARMLRFHDGHVAQQDPLLAEAIQQADALFITLINMREQAEWLAAEIERAGTPTVFAFESMPEVMGLTRVGDYRVAGGKGGMPKPIQAIIRLITRGRDEDTLYAYTKLSKLTTKLLPLMPPKLKDFRTWLSVNLYWQQPDPYNLSQMVRLILRDCLGQPVEVGPVRPIPSMGCFHPDHDGFFPDPKAYLKWYERRRKAEGRRQKAEGRKPLVAIIAFRKHVIQRQQYLADLVRSLEAEGLAALPVVVSGIEMHVAIREWLTPQALGGRTVDLLLNTMGFPIVGGPAGSTKPGHYRAVSADLLGTLDVPYIVAQPLQMQDEAQWRAQGVAPMQAVIMYDLPEMDGSVAPVALGAIREQRIVATPDRLARAARLAAGWARLRHTPNAEKRIGLVVYNFPPGLGKLATAALLDVPASLHALLLRLRADGYRVEDIPATPDELAQQLAALEQPERPPVVLSAREYGALVPRAHAERIDAKWGRAPGDLAPAGDGVRLDGLHFGNVFVGVQPPMGAPGDPMRLLFDREFTPHHQYIAFYRWLSQVWQADALVHVGMHGTAEWMPGLQLGLTAECWPDLLLGELPNLYLYPLNNPAEAAIARRRGYAATVSHAVPPYARAGLYKQLATLRVQVEEGRRQRVEGRLTDQTSAISNLAIPDVPQLSDEKPEAYLDRVDAYLNAIEQRLILDGLHIFGHAPAPERSVALIEAALDIPRNGHPGLSEALRQVGVPADDIAAARAEFVQEYVTLRGERVGGERVGGEHMPRPTNQHNSDPAQPATRNAQRRATQPATPKAQSLHAYIEEGKNILAGLAQCGNELDALLHALGGGYVQPAPGADPVRAGAAALPSGRNIHGIDPWRLPSDAALARGAAMAELLLARHHTATGGTPRTVALTLWALDTIKTEGESIGAALALVGAHPERDGQGKIWRYQLVPLTELGRPRVDVLLDISAIFRDTFQLTLDLLDDLFRRAAAADEPPEQNAVRANALAQQAAGLSWNDATARIFTQAPGHYGTGVDERVEESQWEEAGELAETYLHRNAHAYGGKRGGAAAPQALRGMLGTVEHVFQAIDSIEYGLTDMQHYYGHSGAIQLAAGRERGETVPLSYAETVGAGVRVSSAAELLRAEARAKLLNPRWYEGMLAHGYAGAAEIGARFTYLLGWSATTGAVDPWVYQAMAETFVLDDELRERIEHANPLAAKNAAARLLEAHGRGLWPADDATIERLQALYADLEDRLEGATA